MLYALSNVQHGVQFMLYISKISSNDKVEVTDTKTEVTESYSVEQLIEMNNQGIIVIGIDENGIWDDYSPEDALSRYYTGDLIDSEPLFDALYALRFLDESNKDIAVSSDTHKSDKSISHNDVRCIGARVRVSFPAVITEDDFRRNLIFISEANINPTDLISFYPYEFTNVSAYDIDKEDRIQISHLTSSSAEYSSTKGTKHNKIAYCFRNSDSFAYGKRLISNFDIAADEIRFSTDTNESFVDTSISACISAAETDNKRRAVILSHHVIKETGELVFVIINDFELDPLRTKSNQNAWYKHLIYTGSGCIRLIKLESYMYHKYSNGVSSSFNLSDFNDISSFISNASCTNGVLNYRGVHGKYEIDLRKLINIGKSYTDYKDYTRYRAAMKLLHRVTPFVNMTGQAMTLFPVDENGIVAIPNGIKTISWNFCFESWATEDKVENVKEIIFPESFRDVYDYTGMLKILFRYITSGTDFEPVKLTFKGDYISDFFKPFIK